MTATLSSVFGGANGGISGAVVTAWATERFTTPPALDAAFPSGSPTAGPVTAGDSFGCAGAWRLTVGTAGSYYVCAVFNNVRYWSLMGTGGGGTTGAVERYVLQFRFDTPDLATGVAIPGYVPKKGDTLLMGTGVYSTVPWVATGNAKAGLYIAGQTAPLTLGTTAVFELTLTKTNTNGTWKICEQYEFIVVKEDAATVKLYVTTSGLPSGDPVATPIQGVGVAQIIVIPGTLTPTTPTLPVQAAVTGTVHPTYSVVISATSTHNVLDVTTLATTGPDWTFTVAPGTYANNLALAAALRTATVKKTGVTQSGTLSHYLAVHVNGTTDPITLTMKPVNSTFTGAAGNAFEMLNNTLATQLGFHGGAKAASAHNPTLPSTFTNTGRYVVVQVGTTRVYFFVTATPTVVTTPAEMATFINDALGPTVTGTHLPFSHYATATVVTGKIVVTVKPTGPWGTIRAGTIFLVNYTSADHTAWVKAGFFPTSHPTVVTELPFTLVHIVFTGGLH